VLSQNACADVGADTSQLWNRASALFISNTALAALMHRTEVLCHRRQRFD